MAHATRNHTELCINMYACVYIETMQYSAVESKAVYMLHKLKALRINNKLLKIEHSAKSTQNFCPNSIAY